MKKIRAIRDKRAAFLDKIFSAFDKRLIEEMSFKFMDVHRHSLYNLYCYILKEKPDFKLDLYVDQTHITKESILEQLQLHVAQYKYRVITPKLEELNGRKGQIQRNFQKRRSDIDYVAYDLDEDLESYRSVNAQIKILTEDQEINNYYISSLSRYGAPAHISRIVEDIETLFFKEQSE